MNAQQRGIKNTLRGKKQFLESTLNSLSVHVAVLDGNGEIIAVNQAWRAFAQANGVEIASVSEGVNYLDVCDSARGEFSEEAAIFAAGIRSVMDGDQDTYTLEYPCHSPTEKRWFIGRATRFSGEGPARVVVAHEDITARRLAEDQLHESEEKFKYVFDYSTIGRSITLLSGEVQANKTLCEMLGYTPEEFRNRNWQEITHPDDLEMSEEIVKAILSGERQTARFTKRYVHKNGSIIWVDISTTLRREKEGKPLYFITAVSDITARMQAEKKILLANADMNKAQSYAHLGSWTWDIKANRVAWSDEMYRIFGIAKETFSGDLNEVIARAIHPDDRAKIEEANLKVSRDKTPLPLEYRIVHPDGSIHVVWAEAGELTLDETGSLAMLKGIVQDITERKQVEESMRLQSAALEAAANAIIITDSKGIIEWANPAFENLTGYSIAEAIGKNPKDLVHSGKLSKQFYSDLWNTILAGQVWHNEIINRRKDGTLYTEEMTITPVRSEGQEISHFIAVKQDITEKNHHAQELEAIAAMSRALRTYMPGKEIMPIILQELKKLVGVDGAAISLLDEENDQVIVDVSDGEWKSWVGTTISLEKGILGNVYETNQPVIEESASSRDAADWPGPLEGIQTVVCIPLIASSQMIGALWLGWKRMHLNGNLRVLMNISDISANAIRNALLYKQVEDQVATLTSLYDAGLAINSVLEPHAQLEFLSKIAMDELHAERMIFLRYNPDGSYYNAELCLGFQEETQAVIYQSRYPADETQTPIDWVRINKLPLNNPNISNDLGLSLGDLTVRSVLWAPIKHRDNFRGILGVMSTKINAFNPNQERLMFLFANQAAVALENASLLFETRLQVQRLDSLREIDRAINASLGINITSRVILEQCLTQLEIDAVDIILFNPLTKDLRFINGLGFNQPVLQHSKFHLRRELASRVANTRKLVHVSGPSLQNEFSADSHLMKDEGFIEYYGIPLISKGNVNGVMEIFHRSLLRPDKSWMDFIEMLAGQAAIAIDNIDMFESLQRSNNELLLAYDATIAGWSQAMDLRDKETEGHTLRVTEMTLKLAEALGFKDEDLVHIRRGALLHDIGKLGMPDEILHKAGPLDEVEWAIMKKHPIYAFEMLTPVEYLWPALEIPYCHHEKWDGTGYPRGLIGTQIPSTARMFTVVDVWDALSTDRPYRPAWPKDRVLLYLQEQAGKYFDPEMVEVFLKIINDGEVALY